MPQGNPKAGEFYLHFKNKLYQVLSIAKHTETGELLVIYQALYGDYGVYARPYSMFISDVDHEKYPEVKVKHRFTLVDPDALRQAAGGGLPLTEILAAERADERQKPEEKNGQPGRHLDSSMPDLAEPERNRGSEDSTGFISQESATEESDSGKTVSEKSSEESESGEPGVSPLLLAFLDTDSFSEKYRILEDMKNELELTDTLIDNLAASMDVIIPDGPIDDRYEHLKYAISKRMQFESDRFRR